MKSIAAKISASFAVIFLFIALTANAMFGCHGTVAGTVNCDPQTGQQIATWKLHFPLSSPVEDWQTPDVSMRLVSDPGGETPNGTSTRANGDITVIQRFDGSSTETVNYAPELTWVKDNGDVITTNTAESASITLPGDCKAPIPTSATGSVNQSACNTSSDVETWTVAFDVTGEPDASADVTYNWTAEGHTYDGTLGNFGIGSHTAEIDTPDWATPGMQLMLTVDYTIAGNESKPGLIAQINPVKGTCKATPPAEPTDVSNPPVVVTSNTPPAECTEEESKAGTCLAFTGAGDGTMKVALYGSIVLFIGSLCVRTGRRFWGIVLGNTIGRLWRLRTLGV